MIRDYDHIYLREPETEMQFRQGSFDFSVYDQEGEEYPVVVKWSAEWSDECEPENITFEVIGFNQPIDKTDEEEIRREIITNQIKN